MTVPAESHAHVFTKNQKKYNLQLLAGVGLFGFTTLVAVNTVNANGTPAYLKDSAFVTKLPESVTEEVEDSTEAAEENVAEDGVEEAAAAEVARIAAEEAAAAEATKIAAEEAAAAEVARIAAEAAVAE